MKIYVANTYSAPNLLQPRYFDGLMHTGQKVTADKNDAVQYAKDTIKERSELYGSELFSNVFGKNIKVKHEDDALMQYSLGPYEKGLYMIYIQIDEYEV